MDKPNTTEQLLQLEQELADYRPAMSQAIQTILDSDVSKYPILVVHQQADAQVGLPIIQAHSVAGQWSVNASTLEEFVAKNLINTDKVEFFTKTYKNPDTHICAFVVSELGATFIFLPRTAV